MLTLAVRSFRFQLFLIFHLTWVGKSPDGYVNAWNDDVIDLCVDGECVSRVSRKTDDTHSDKHNGPHTMIKRRLSPVADCGAQTSLLQFVVKLVVQQIHNKLKQWTLGFSAATYGTYSTRDVMSLSVSTSFGRPKTWPSELVSRKWSTVIWATNQLGDTFQSTRPNNSTVTQETVSEVWYTCVCVVQLVVAQMTLLQLPRKIWRVSAWPGWWYTG